MTNRYLLFLLLLTLKVVVNSANENYNSTNNLCLQEINALDCNRIHLRVVKEGIQRLGEIRDKLNVIGKALDILRSQYEELSQAVPPGSDRSHYLETLPNSFALIRRLAKTWPVLKNVIGTTVGSYMKVPKLPVKADELWTSAVTGLVRLQETYNLSTEAVASGDMAGAYTQTSLTADDCFDVALFYYRLKYPGRAVEWLLEALRRAQQHQKAKIMEYLHLAYCFKGDVERSSDTLMALLRDFPAFSPSEELRGDYSYTSNKSCKVIGEELKQSLYKDLDRVHNVEMQAGLCREENYRSPTDPRLRCRLLHHNHHHLRLAPFKLEELNIDPPLLMFHGVIHEGEINHLKKLYHYKTKHAIYDPEYNSETNPYVDTQQSYLFYQPDPVETKVTRRASDIVNMNLRGAQETMLASYGIAGEIKMHDDLEPGADPENLAKSRADHGTFLFYLSNVPEGGYTIYPKIERAVVPVQGNAMFWFNRNPDFSKIEKMIHSGCPVLRGNKWILSKWFHSVGQDFPKCLPGKENSYEYFYL